MPPENRNTSSFHSVLSSYGFSSSVIEAWARDGMDRLLPIQAQALETGLLSGNSMLVLGPTSCGKTFVGEMAAIFNTLVGRPCIYLVPFKAIAEEKYRDFTRKYSQPGIEAQVVISTADRRQDDRRIIAHDFHIAVLTYEKLSSLLVLHPLMIKQVGTLIVDELQMVCDFGRGAELELLLTRIRQISPNIQVIGLTAAVSDVNGFDEWLGATVVTNEHRPVPLREGAVTPDGSFVYREWQETERIAGVENLPSFNGVDEEQQGANFVASLLRNENEQVLVFANTVAATQELAKQIAALSPCSPAIEAIKELETLELSQSVESLKSCMQGSIAFHNSELTFEERQTVEKQFRAREIRCIVSTSTLAMGVNLPASTVIIVKPTKWQRVGGEWDEVAINVGEYRNMSGRAGRFGILNDSFGRSVHVCSRAIDRDAFIGRYVDGVTEPISSVMAHQELSQMVLKLFASGLCATEDGAVRFLRRSYCAAIHWSTDAQVAQLTIDIGQVVAQLTNYELLHTNQGKIQATKLGRICASSGLSVDTFASILAFVKCGSESIVDLALLASRGHDTGADSGVGIRLSTNEFKHRVDSFLHYLEGLLGTFTGSTTESFINRFTSGHSNPTYEEAKELKYQCVALSYVQGDATKSIEDHFGVRGGQIRAVGGMCSWLADTASKIAWAIGNHGVAKEMEIIAERFLNGCTKESLFLSYVNHSLFRQERELLVAAGYTSFQSIIAADPTDIARSAKVRRMHVQGLQRAILDAYGNELDLQRQQVARLNNLGIKATGVEELYVATGTALERELEDFFGGPFCVARVRRITEQNTGEADLRIDFADGSVGIAQVNAREDHNLVGVVKSGSVLQQSPELKPRIFICIGRPGFDEAAIKKAGLHASNNINFKLITIATLVEIYVRFHEGRLPADRIEAVLQNETGYLTIERFGV